MTGLDSNILLRYLAQDDPIQSPLATKAIERGLTERGLGFVSVVTMAEIVWVLDRVYGLTDQEIANAVERILQADTLYVQNEQEVFTAMIALRKGAGQFADALISALNSWAGCKHTLTFDRRAARLSGFKLL